MQRYESDVCIIGGGITAAMLALKLSELRPNLSITVVEAGKRLFDTENRMEYRQRSIEYAENAWPGDFIEDQAAQGVISRTMAVGGSALHWGGTCNRFSEEDLRLKSMFGLYTDWPLAWTELEKFYCEAERRLGVSGEPSPFAEDRRSEPYPMAAMAMTHNLIELKKWAEQSGIPFQTTPQAKNTEPYDGRAKCIRCNTCAICPTGARYSPDYTFRRLLQRKNFALHDQTLVRKLVLDDAKSTVAAAEAVSYQKPDEPVEYRAPVFALTSGYCWSPHLLLLSRSPRFPNGLANSSGLVGRYMCGHAFESAMIEIDAKNLSGHERAARSDLAPVFPRQGSRPFRAARFARVGKRRRARAADARRRWTNPAGRQPAGRLAPARPARHGARPRILRCASGPRQLVDARRLRQEPLRRRAAQDRASFGRRHASAPRVYARPFPAAFSKAGAGRQRQSVEHQDRGTIWTIRPADAAWATTRRRASATAMGKRTTTKTCSWRGRPRCQMRDVPTAR